MLTDLDWTIRTLVYDSFVAEGDAPHVEELAEAARVEGDAVTASLDRLAAAREIVFHPGGGIWMAHPFSAIPTDYPVDAGPDSWWANCAWDAVAIPHLLAIDAWTITECPDCEAPLTILTDGGRTESDAGVVHFAVPARRFWEDIGYT